MNRQMLLLKALSFLYYATTAVLLPFLPIYFERQGFSSLQIGLLMMIGPFAAIFAQPVWGFVSDRLQTVKSIILLLWLMTVLASLGLFNSAGFAAALTFSTLLYFFMVPSVPLLDSMSIKAALQTGKTYGSVRLWGSAGFAAIAAVSGLVAVYTGGVGSIQYVYWILWVPAFVLLPFLQDERAAAARQRVTWNSLQLIARNRELVWFFFVILLGSIPHRMNDVLLAVYMQDAGASGLLIGLAWTLAAGSEVPTFALLGRVMHRYHELALLALASLFYAIRWILYASINDPFVLTLLQLFHSVTFAVFWMTSVQYVVRLVPLQLRSTGQSLLAAVFIGLAGLIGGTVGGWIYDRWGGEGMYLFGAGVSLLVAMLFAATREFQKKNALQ